MWVSGRAPQCCEARLRRRRVAMVRKWPHGVVTVDQNTESIKSIEVWEAMFLYLSGMLHCVGPTQSNTTVSPTPGLRRNPKTRHGPNPIKTLCRLPRYKQQHSDLGSLHTL